MDEVVDAQKKQMAFLSRYPERGATEHNFFSVTPPSGHNMFYIFPNKTVIDMTLLRVLNKYPKDSTIFIFIQYRETPIIMPALPDYARKRIFSIAMSDKIIQMPQENTQGYIDKAVGLRLWAALL